jgi:DNA-binding beta-propeller fold protein YncE
VAVGPEGSLYIADRDNGRIRRVSRSGIITSVEGSVSWPLGVAVDARGNIYIADSAANRVLRVSPAGIVSTVAGNGEYEFSGDGGPATEAGLAGPEGVAVDAAGNLYIADSGNDRIRKVILR